MATISAANNGLETAGETGAGSSPEQPRREAALADDFQPVLSVRMAYLPEPDWWHCLATSQSGVVATCRLVGPKLHLPPFNAVRPQ